MVPKERTERLGGYVSRGFCLPTVWYLRKEALEGESREIIYRRRQACSYSYLSAEVANEIAPSRSHICL